MTTYYGLTLGPIYKTLGRLRATRELWGGSFYFSLLMRRIVEAIKTSRLGIEILLPYPDVPEQDLKNGVGLFPDRLIATGPTGQGDALYQLLRGALDTLSREIAGDVKGWEPGAVAAWFGEYIQTYFFEATYDSPSKAILGLNELMDSAELMPPFQKQEKELYLFAYLNKHGHKAKSLLFREAFTEEDQEESRILSIPEIACMGFAKEREDFRKRVLDPIFRETKDEDDEQFYLQLKAKDRKLGELLRTHHRYIAIVHADGDNVGSTIKKLQTQKEVLNLSQALFDFGVGSEGLIKNFGGKLVYAGGDDLLFFAPVLSGKTSIFSLCQQLDGLFKEAIQQALPADFYDRESDGSGEQTKPDDPNKEKKKEIPSLSFGVSISYHKFPLYEALEDSRELLFEKAKKWPEPKNRLKNALSLRLLKHSGQHIGQTFGMQQETFTAFSGLLAAQLKEDDRFLSSVMFMLDKQKAVFDELGKLPSYEDRETRIRRMIDANFDEEIHSQEASGFMDKVKDLIVKAYEDYRNHPEPGDAARAAVYSALRTIHFLKQPYDA